MTATATPQLETLPPHIAEFCERAVEALRAKLPVREVWLFGSHAEGTAKPDSDVDLFVVLADDHGIRNPTLECRGALDGIRPFPRRDLDISALAESYWHHPRYRQFGLWSDVAEKGICLFDSGEFFAPQSGELPLMPGDPTVPQTWFARARKDLRAAKLLLSHEELGLDLLHFQQAAEKVMKGWLIERGWHLIKTHEIDELCSEVERLGVQLDRLVHGKALTKAFFQSSYPAPDNGLTRSDVEAISARIERLFSELGIPL